MSIVISTRGMTRTHQSLAVYFDLNLVGGFVTI